MGKKTPSQFEDEISNLSPNILLLSDYSGVKNPVSVLCKVCGHTWSVRPDSLLRGSGCPKCAAKARGNKRRTKHHDFVNNLAEVSPTIEVIGQYRASAYPIEVRCSECGYVWKTKPSHLLAGTGCRRCAAARLSQKYRIPDSEFRERLARINPNVRPLEEYKSANSHILVECAICGTAWRTTPAVLLRGNGCPACARKSTSFIEQLIYRSFVWALGEGQVESRDKALIGMELDIVVPSLRLAVEPGSWYWHEDKTDNDALKRRKCHDVGYTCLTIYDSYPNCEPPFDSDCFVYRVDLGQNDEMAIKAAIDVMGFAGIDVSLNAPWVDLIAVARDSATRKTTDLFEDELRQINNQIEVLGRYRSSKTPLKVRCKTCGNVWESTPSNLLLGSGCPKCSKASITRSQDDFVLKLKLIHPTIEVLGAYKNNKTKLDVKCLQCGYEWEATPSNLYRVHGCPNCKKNNKNNKKKDTQSFIDELKQVNPLIEVMGNYVNLKTRILVSCSKCGYEWEPSPSNLLQGSGCPKCSGCYKRTPEEFVEELRLKNPSIRVLTEFENLTTKVEVECKKCTYRWHVVPKSLLNGHGCPKCSRLRKN